MAEEMEKEDWIKSAVPNEEAKDIIVTTTDGYIYEVYYDEETGKKEIDYIGKEDGKGIPTITASYDKVKAMITAKAECKGGIKEIQLIYKKEVVQTQAGEIANFSVQETGWYQVKAVANNGKTRSTWIRVSSTVIAPLIEVISDGEQENQWYGKDDKVVEVRISTDNPTVTGVYYKTNKDEEFTSVEGKEVSLTIQESGRTIIYAYVTDKQGNESEQANKEIKYDNVHPQVGEISIEGTKGTIDEEETGWYVSEEVTIKLNNMTDEPIESGIEGYYYWEIPEGSNPNEITEEQKTYVKGNAGQIKITKTREGKVTIGIQAKDKAGNKTEAVKTITIYKDSVAPVDFLPNIIEGSKTSNGFTITAGTTDATSEISHYNFYVRQGNAIVKELKNTTEGKFEATGLEPNITYGVTVEAVDRAGNIRTGTGITGTTKGKVVTPIISINPSTPNGQNSWYNNGNITITINDGETDNIKSGVTQIVYTLDGTTVPIAGRTATVTINADGTHTIKAYATDGSVNSGETTEYTIKRDVTDPTVSLGTPTEVTISGMTVTANASDSTSGVATYKFQASTASNFSSIAKESTAQTGSTYTFSGLNDGTTYYIRVIVTDNAGRTGTSSIVTQNTVVANTPPTFAQNSSATKVWNSSTKTTSFTIKAKANDADSGNKLTYKVYMKLKSESDSAYKVVGTASDKNPGTEVTINVSQYNGTNLANYTEYNWKVEVTDNIASPVSEGNVTTTQTFCATADCPLSVTDYTYCTSCSNHDGCCTTCYGSGMDLLNSGTDHINCEIKARRSYTIRGKAIGVANFDSNCQVCGKKYSASTKNYYFFVDCPEGHGTYARTDNICGTCFNQYQVGSSVKFTTGNYAICKIGMTCSSCQGSGSCSRCNGRGWTSYTTKCSKHSLTYSHRYCPNGHSGVFSDDHH